MITSQEPEKCRRAVHGMVTETQGNTFVISGGSDGLVEYYGGIYNDTTTGHDTAEALIRQRYVPPLGGNR